MGFLPTARLNIARSDFLEGPVKSRVTRRFFHAPAVTTPVGGASRKRRAAKEQTPPPGQNVRNGLRRATRSFFFMFTWETGID